MKKLLIAALLFLALPATAHAGLFDFIVAAAAIYFLGPAGASLITGTQVALTIGVMAYGQYQSRQLQKQQEAARRQAVDAYNAGLEDRTITSVSTEAPHVTVYGRARVGSAVVAILTSGSRDQYQHIIAVHAAHECEAIEEVYIASKALGPLDPDGFPVSGQFANISTQVKIEAIGPGTTQLQFPPQNEALISCYREVDGVQYAVSYTVSGDEVTISDPDAIISYYYTATNPTVRVKKHLGNAGDPADATLIAELPDKWDSAKMLTGYCYTYIRLDLNEPEFQGGLPAIEALIKGKKILDPRTDTTAWSENPALVTYDYLRGENCGIDAADINTESVETAADVCDQEITIPNEIRFQSGTANMTLGGAYPQGNHVPEYISVWPDYLNAGANAIPGYIVGNTASTSSNTKILLRAGPSGALEPCHVVIDDDVTAEADGGLGVQKNESLMGANPTDRMWLVGMFVRRAGSETAILNVNRNIGGANGNVEDVTTGAVPSLGNRLFISGGLSSAAWNLTCMVIHPLGAGATNSGYSGAYNMSGTQVGTLSDGEFISSQTGFVFYHRTDGLTAGDNSESTRRTRPFVIQLGAASEAPAVIQYLIQCAMEYGASVDLSPYYTNVTNIRLEQTAADEYAESDYVILNNQLRRFNIFNRDLAGDYIDGTVNWRITGNTETSPLYTFNGTVSSDQEQTKVIGQMCQAMAGGINSTTWEMWAGAYVTPTVTLEQEDIVGALTINPGISDAEIFNGVTGRFIGPENNYVPVDMKPYQNAVYRSSDGRDLYASLEFPFTDGTQRLHNLSRIYIEDQRNSFTVQAQFSHKAWDIRVGQRIYLNSAFFGFTSKVFRVVAKSFSYNGTVQLTLKEDAAEIWDLEDAVEIDATPNSDLPNPFVLDPPGVPSVTEELYETTGSGGVKARAIVSWMGSENIRVTGYFVEYRLVTETEFRTTATVSTNEVVINDIAPGTYEFRVAAVNSYFSVNSAYSDISTKLISGLTANPGDVSGFNVIALSGRALGSWTLTTDLDVRIGGRVVIRHTPLTSGVAWENGVIVEEFNGDAVNGNLPLMTGTYFAKFRDSSGNYSATAASFVATESLVSGYTTTHTQTESTAFSGSKTNLTVTAGELFITTLSGSNSLGTYLFNTYMDFGSVVQRKIDTTIKTLSYSTSDLVDSWPMIDDVDSIDGATINSCDATLYYRATNDNPAGTPTYGAWTQFIVADVNCRALQFKLELTSTNDTQNIKVTELSVRARSQP